MSLIGNTNAEKIWNYLYSKLENAYGVAGIMGNIQAESGLSPTNLQNTYEKKLGLNDAQYTAGVDNGTYTNFIYDSAGYGLVQWTYWSLKRDLYNYVKSHNASIGNLEIQLEFLCYQLSNQYTSSVWNVCKNATSVLEASNAMLLKFERPADQSVSAQNRRASFGQTFYNQFANKTTNTPVEQPIGGTTMSVTIGHASIDENGRATGGVAGDQTRKEVYTRTWYNKPWLAVFRPSNSVIAEKIAVAMEQACANNKIGYDQSQRTTLYTYAKQNNWDLSKITTACETDCSALVAVCINAAGIPVSRYMYTGNEESLLMATGSFTKLTDSKYLTGSDYLKRGDILLGSGHTAIVLSNGAKATTETITPINNTAYAGKGIGTAISKTSMNIRTGPSTSYSAISTISKGTKVEVLEVLNSGWYKIVWPGASCGYAYTSNSQGAYYTYTAKVVETPSTPITSSTFLVKVTASALNIRKGPGTNYSITGCIRDKGTYTIVQQQNNWGKLKSGAGWICLDYTVKK